MTTPAGAVADRMVNEPILTKSGPDPVEQLDFTRELAVCPRCDGLIVPDALVAAGFEAVPRDQGGKWCKGAGCQLSPEEHSGMTPGVKAGHTKKLMKGKAAHVAAEQAKYDAMTPGKKAAYTKAKNKKAAEAAGPTSTGPAQNKNPAPAPKVSPQTANANVATHAQQTPTGKADTDAEILQTKNVPLAADTVDNMSYDAQGKYLAKNMDASKVPKAADERFVMAHAVAKQHGEDAALLSKLGYGPIAGPAGSTHQNMSPRDSRRAVLRETGVRKPTGGPNSGGAHVVFTDAQIDGMGRAKHEQIIQHHTAGQTPKSFFANASDEMVKSDAKHLNDDFAHNVYMLKTQGHAEATIPHSRHSTQHMLNTQSGLPAKPFTASINTASTSAGKPANWHQLSPGQKAAWTKKAKAGLNPGTPTPHPADWASMSPGKKAAWTKAHKASGVSTSGPVTKPVLKAGTTVNGKHTSNTFESDSGAKAAFVARTKQADASFDSTAHSHRYSAFQNNKNVDQQAKGAVNSYTGSGYATMNQKAKKGSTDFSVQNMDRAFKQGGTPAPPRLVRGKRRGALKDLKYNIGDEYTDPKFGSFSGRRSTALSFAGGADTQTKRSVFTHVLDSKGINSIPGTQGEMETIMPLNTTYRVLAIEDFIGPGSHHRVLEVEVVL